MDADAPSASCRIVVVSSSVDKSREVANRIKNYSGDTTDAQPSLEVIHWTIKNKYYTAPVHFHPIHLEGLEFIELDDVPAIIYAWGENEPYKTHMKQVVEHTSSYSPEVSLAISTAPTTDEELEDFFFEHGFEYVEGHTQTPDESAGLATSSGTPGIHRAIDALSTIMWPSMIRTATTGPKLSPHPEPSIATGEDTDETDIDYETLVNAAGNDGKTNMQREMEMLERWLEEDDENYRQLPENGHDEASSQSIGKLDEAWSTEDSTSRQVRTGAEGFDDDFTEFQSAPTTSSREIQNTESNLDEDLDSEWPSTGDIHAAATRIFGPLPVHAARPDAFAVLSDSAEPSDTSQPVPPPESVSDPHTGAARAGPELDMDEPAFDLTRILGALDAMKDEISRIPDMRERRRAAAKAALGFVYGLEETNDELDAAASLG